MAEYLASIQNVASSSLVSLSRPRKRDGVNIRAAKAGMAKEAIVSRFGS
jgi:hypothetical protein